MFIVRHLLQKKQLCVDIYLYGYFASLYSPLYIIQYKFDTITASSSMIVREILENLELKNPPCAEEIHKFDTNTAFNSTMVAAILKM